MKYDFYIGIDPGVNTGFATWDSNYKRFERIESMAIHDAMQCVKDELASAKTLNNKLLIRVEDARQRKWFGERSVIKLQGAGSIKRDCQIWNDFLDDLKCNYQMVDPTNNNTKLTAEKFKLITGYSGKTNEHSRDAAMLVYGF